MANFIVTTLTNADPIIISADAFQLDNGNNLFFVNVGDQNEEDKVVLNIVAAFNNWSSVVREAE